MTKKKTKSHDLVFKKEKNISNKYRKIYNKNIYIKNKWLLI